ENTSIAEPAAEPTAAPDDADGVLIAHEPENTSIAEPAAEPTAAPDDADGVLVDSVTPNKTLTERAQALAAKVAKHERRPNAKLLVPARAIQATVAESRGLPGASTRERFKELVLNALVAENLAPKQIAHEPENTSIAEPAAEPTAAPDDADGVLIAHEPQNTSIAEPPAD